MVSKTYQMCPHGNVEVWICSQKVWCTCEDLTLKVDLQWIKDSTGRKAQDFMNL